MNTSIYIDTTTGAFGGAQELVIVDATDEQIENLQDRPDSTIIAFGLEHGRKALVMPPQGSVKIGISEDAGVEGAHEILRQLIDRAFKVTTTEGTFEGLLVAVNNDFSATFRPWDEGAGDYREPAIAVSIDKLKEVVYL